MAFQSNSASQRLTHGDAKILAGIGKTPADTTETITVVGSGPGGGGGDPPTDPNPPSSGGSGGAPPSSDQVPWFSSTPSTGFASYGDSAEVWSEKSGVGNPVDPSLISQTQEFTDPNGQTIDASFIPPNSNAIALQLGLPNGLSITVVGTLSDASLASAAGWAGSEISSFLNAAGNLYNQYVRDDSGLSPYARTTGPVTDAKSTLGNASSLSLGDPSLAKHSSNLTAGGGSTTAQHSGPQVVTPQLSGDASSYWSNAALDIFAQAYAETTGAGAATLIGSPQISTSSASGSSSYIQQTTAQAVSGLHTSSSDGLGSGVHNHHQALIALGTN